MRQFVLGAALVLAMAGTCLAKDQRAQFKAITAQEQGDPHGTYSAMMSLAEEGYAPAIDRVGYYLRKGIGTRTDLEAARHWYMRAVEAGHPWSTASLARVEIELGRGDTALQLLHAGVLEGLPGTERLLATAHIDRKLGAASDPQQGRAMLERMARNGDRNAARDLVVRFNWKRLDGQASAAAVDQVVRAGLDGDARFAKAGLTYLSQQTDKGEAAIRTRALLAAIPGIPDRTLSPELVRLAADTHPRQFWTKVEDILAATETDNYARTASTAFWINKNAWVRVLQKELRALGYYKGRINGRMTTRTIRAQNRYCRERGLWAICATGPLRGATVRAVAGAIALDKKSL